MTPRLWTLSLLFVSLPVTGLAQDNAASSPRPYRGLFGDGGGQQRLLTFRGSVGGGFDDNVVADARGGSVTSVRPSDTASDYRSQLAFGSAGLSSEFERGTFSLSADAETMGRYYPRVSDSIVRRDRARVQTEFGLPLGFSADLRADYRPFNLSSFFPTLIDPDSPATVEPDFGDDSVSALDLASSNRHHFSYRGEIGYGHNFSPRTSFGANYSYRARTSGTGGYVQQTAGARISHNLSQNLILRIGYSRSRVDYEASDRSIIHHGIDGGVDYRRAFSLLRSKRTFLSFSTGTSATGGGRLPADDVQTEDRATTRFRLRATGNVRLSHELGRSWHASVSYNRGVMFAQDWPEPMFSDSLSAYFGGLFTRRVQFHSSFRTSIGRAERDDSGGFDAYYATTGLSFALARPVSAGVSYSYYRHRFDGSATLASGFSDSLDRKSIRAYVSVWAPIF